jgi:hypothetical protein
VISVFQTFFKDHMGVDLYMEPNFENYSCQVIEIQECTTCYVKTEFEDTVLLVSVQLWSASPASRHRQGPEGTLPGHMHER